MSSFSPHVSDSQRRLFYERIGDIINQVDTYPFKDLKFRYKTLKDDTDTPGRWPDSKEIGETFKEAMNTVFEEAEFCFPDYSWSASVWKDSLGDHCGGVKSEVRYAEENDSPVRAFEFFLINHRSRNSSGKVVRKDQGLCKIHALNRWGKFVATAKKQPFGKIYGSDLADLIYKTTEKLKENIS